MKRHGFLVCAIALAAALLSTAAEADRRVAFVIGNSAYRNATSLPNTINDANAVAALFRSVGFEVVTSRTDLGVLEFKRAVRDFLITAETADIAVVYYAGHGIEVGGTNYLIPVDAKLARDYDVEDEAVALDRIIWALQSVKRLRLILLDACRDNPFAAKLQRSVGLRAATKGGLAKLDDVSADTLVAYAAKAGSVSYDGVGPNSPFAAALLKHVAEPGLDIRIALGRVRDEVLKVTGGRQEPFIYGSLAEGPPFPWCRRQQRSRPRRRWPRGSLRQGRTPRLRRSNPIGRNSPCRPPPMRLPPKPSLRKPSLPRRRLRARKPRSTGSIRRSPVPAMNSVWRGCAPIRPRTRSPASGANSRAIGCARKSSAFSKASRPGRRRPPTCAGGSRQRPCRPPSAPRRPVPSRERGRRGPRRSRRRSHVRGTPNAWRVCEPTQPSARSPSSSGNSPASTSGLSCAGCGRA